jgi:hypothetical protein
VADQANNSTVLPNQALCYTSSVILGTIVNKNDLIGRRKGRECGKRIGNERIEVLGLVVAREEERELL